MDFTIAPGKRNSGRTTARCILAIEKALKGKHVALVVHREHMITLVCRILYRGNSAPTVKSKHNVFDFSPGRVSVLSDNGDSIESQVRSYDDFVLDHPLDFRWLVERAGYTALVAQRLGRTIEASICSAATAGDLA